LSWRRFQKKNDKLARANNLLTFELDRQRGSSLCLTVPPNDVIEKTRVDRKKPNRKTKRQQAVSIAPLVEARLVMAYIWLFVSVTPPLLQVGRPSLQQPLAAVAGHLVAGETTIGPAAL